jgi:hypothetical protein
MLGKAQSGSAAPKHPPTSGARPIVSRDVRHIAIREWSLWSSAAFFRAIRDLTKVADGVA